jgi:hypothetical protein
LCLPYNIFYSITTRNLLLLPLMFSLVFSLFYCPPFMSKTLFSLLLRVTQTPQHDGS